MSRGKRQPRWRRRAACAGTIGAGLLAPWLVTLGAPAPDAGDARIRTTVYAADEVYRLQGYVGFQIDLEFESGEAFVGLGAGDVESLAFASQDNHLFLKPRAAGIDTNLTVLTNRRSYHFEYLASARRPDGTPGDAVYVLRFVYPLSAGTDRVPQSVERPLAQAATLRPHNLDYAYCGSPGLKPAAAWDDGIQTHLRFGARQELPALFVHNEDGSESLVNFSVDGGEVIVHRIARRFVVRRGQLLGCIVNQRFAGTGAELSSGTLAPGVRRVTRGTPP
jgi:type IV secretion system protein VirB9